MSDIKLGIPPSQRKGNQWYLRHGRNIMELDALLSLQPSKTVSYFKIEYKSRGGSRTEIKYCKTLGNGYMIFVDAANMKIGIVQGFGYDRGITGSNKKEYTTAFRKVLKILSQ